VKFAAKAYVQVPMSKIVGPGNVKQRQASAHVQELAADIRELGDEPINAIAARKGERGWEIVAGRDRYSALLLNKAKRTWVHVVETATRQELHDLEVSENLHRRVDDRDAMIRDRVRKVAERVTSERSSVTDVPKQPGRPKSAEGVARERVAASLGTTPAAVKQAEHRAKVREEGAAREVVGNGAGAPTQSALGASPAPSLPVETHGRAFPFGWVPRAEIVQEALGEVNAAAIKALVALRKLDGTSAAGIGDWRPSVLQKLRELAQALGAEARMAKPAHACVCCEKGNGGNTGCKLCGGLERTLTEEQWKALPPEQREPGVHAAGLDADPDPADDCAHAYREGAKPTGECLHCGAPGAPQWAEADAMPQGPGASRDWPSSAFVLPRGKKNGKRVAVIVNGREMTEEELAELPDVEPPPVTAHLDAADMADVGDGPTVEYDDEIPL
jgi:hypothetical protein